MDNPPLFKKNGDSLSISYDKTDSVTGRYASEGGSSVTGNSSSVTGNSSSVTGFTYAYNAEGNLARTEQVTGTLSGSCPKGSGTGAALTGKKVLSAANYLYSSTGCKMFVK